MTKKVSTPRTWPAPLLAGLAHAALMMLAAPPLNIWPLVFVAVAPLMWIVRRPTARPWRDALLVTIGVLPMWGVWQWWTAEVTAAGYVPFICLQSSYAGLFVLIAGRVARRFTWGKYAPVLAIMWTAVEFFRGELFLDGYAWGLLAHPLIAVTLLASPAALLGTYFVSFLVATVNAAILDLGFPPRPARRAVFVLAGSVVCWGVGMLLLPPISPSGPKVRAGIVQTNVPQSNKIDWSLEREIEDWKKFESLTMKVAGYQEPRPKPDFIIWPETMMPGPTLEPKSLALYAKEKVFYISDTSVDKLKVNATAFADRLLMMQDELAIPMLVGAVAKVGLNISYNSDGKLDVRADSRYNSVYLVNGGHIQPARYDKVCLTPFGETMPYIHYWPWLQQQMLAVGANGMKFDLDAGAHMTVFSVPAASLGRDVRVVTPVCFEVTVASHCRHLVFDHGERRADLIVSVTNDGWFSDTDIARLQHLQCGRWRCVELATPMARAANTGISAIVDAHGRVLARGVEGNSYGAHVDGVLENEVPLGTQTTLYARVGDVFAWATLAASLSALLASFFRRRTSPVAEQGK